MLNELKSRWQAELPDFWKSVRQKAMWASGMFTAIWTADQTMGLGLPNWIHQVCKYGVIVCIVTGLNAQFTQKDPDNDRDHYDDHDHRDNH